MNPNRNVARNLAFAVAAVGVAAGLWLLVVRRPALPAAPVHETLRRDLVLKDGRWYLRDQTNLFTGWMADYYPNGAKLSYCQISNGLLDGQSETWYPNGQMQVREHFKDGVSDGLREKWHENGQRLSEAT